eukprot:TRINITY_DN1169_c0_g1_i10.p1 TRINITY_DN1169_c0_g1~~TRINITY_DN1169_c0_g1_i10.p1  ORF type:complete len:186 (-),score=49.23 TRINITY_DN1169_c0_g1_i10:195-752(-)
MFGRNVAFSVLVLGMIVGVSDALHLATRYNKCDPKWARQTKATSTRDICFFGDDVTVLASVISTLNLPCGGISPCTPAVLNQFLIKNSGYNSGFFISGEKIGKLKIGLRYRGVYKDIPLLRKSAQNDDAVVIVRLQGTFDHVIVYTLTADGFNGVNANAEEVTLKNTDIMFGIVFSRQARRLHFI